MTAALSGVLVADFSRVLAGPLACMQLADLGATVVKVERPGTGDETRSWGPPWTAGSSSYFDAVNRGKYGIALDLTVAHDAAVARQLAARADVVVENFRAGSLARFGLDHASVAAVNPRVVYCSISGFGDGPGAGRPGYDFLVQAVGGLMSVTGAADGDATKVGVALVDVLTGKDAVIGILAALRRREATGRGDHVRVELLSSLLAGLVNQAAGYLATGTSPGRMGNRHPSIAPYETLQCADGPLAVACGNDGQFARLCAAIGTPQLATDPRFDTNPHRVEHRETLVAELEGSLGTADAETWERRLLAADVPAGRVGDIGDALSLAANLGLEPLMSVGSPAVSQVRAPVRFGDDQPGTAGAPPALGEHQREVLAWLADGSGGLAPRRS